MSEKPPKPILNAQEAARREVEVALARQRNEKKVQMEETTDKERKNKIEAGQPQEDARDAETTDADSVSREEISENQSNLTPIEGQAKYAAHEIELGNWENVKMPSMEEKQDEHVKAYEANKEAAETVERMSEGPQKTPQTAEMPIEMQRDFHDGDLLLDGAEYEIDDKGNRILKPTANQIEKAREEMDQSRMKEVQDKYKDLEKLEDLAKSGNYEEALDIAKKAKGLNKQMYQGVAAIAIENGEFDIATEIARSNGEYKNNVLDAIAQALCRTGQMEKAMSVIDDMEASSARDNSLRCILPELAKQNPELAQKYLETIRGDATRILAQAGMQSGKRVGGRIERDSSGREVLKEIWLQGSVSQIEEPAEAEETKEERKTIQDSRKEISDLRKEIQMAKVEANDLEKIRELEDKLRALETGVEGTPKENREKLKEVIGRFENLKNDNGKEEKGQQNEHVKTYKEYLGNRSEELNTEAKKSGLEGVFRWMGEKYNKLGWKSKLGVGLAFGLGAAAFTTVSMPIAFTCMSGIAAQRIAGLASSFLKYEKKGKGKEGFWAGKKGAMLKAMAYSFGMSAAIGGAVHLASESSYGEAVHEWLKHHYPFGHAEVATQHAGTRSTNDYETMKGMLGQEKPKINMDHVGISSPEVPALEMPDISVEASAGHGYEWMMKRMYEQLNDANLDPEQYPEGSDIRQLLDADDSTIDAVVHRIASNPDHGFFNPDGTSVQIDHDAYMTIDADGQINLDDVIQAPEGATVTPEYHPEASISEPSSVETPATPEAPTSHTETPIAQDAPHTHAEIQAQDTVGHTKEFINQQNLQIDPIHGHVFQDRIGATIAYGNDFDARFEAAQDFAKANPGTSVWVQAEHPVLDPTTNTLRPWIHELIYESGKINMLNPVGPTSLDQIGSINPDTFTKQLDVK